MEGNGKDVQWKWMDMLGNERIHKGIWNAEPPHLPLPQCLLNIMHINSGSLRVWLYDNEWSPITLLWLEGMYREADFLTSVCMSGVADLVRWAQVIGRIDERIRATKYQSNFAFLCFDVAWCVQSVCVRGMLRIYHPRQKYIKSKMK